MTCGVKVKKGSFRGVEFHFDWGGDSGGRRGATHEYPFRNDHYDEDLGKSAPRFNVSGYITGADVRDQQRRLRNAFNAPGHGAYYDAWLNEDWLVRCENFTFSEDRRDLSTIRFSANFVERGIEPAPTAIRTAIASLSGVLTEFNEALATGYNLINGTFDAVQSNIDGFQSAGSYFGFSLRRNFAASDDTVGLVDALESGNPYNNGFELVGAGIEAVVSSQDDAKQTAFLLDLVNIEANAGPEAELQALSMSGQALGVYAGLVIGRDYTSQTQASQALVLFTQNARTWRMKAENVGLKYAANIALKLASLAGERAGRELGDIPKLASRNGNGKPALVLSYEIYGNVSRTKEIMTNNNAVNGSAMQGDIQYVIPVSA